MAKSVNKSMQFGRCVSICVAIRCSDNLLCKNTHAHLLNDQNARPNPPGSSPNSHLCVGAGCPVRYSPAAGGALHGPLVASRAVTELHSDPKRGSFLCRG